MRTDYAPAFSLAASLLLCLAIHAAPNTASAQSVSHGGGDFGLGLIIGDPTGINGKYFLSPEMAIDGSIGLGFIGHRHVQLNMDFLWHFGVQRWSAVGLDLYVGVGPMLGFYDHDDRRNNNRDDELWLGARAPFGASLSFNRAPFDIFVELALGLWVVHDVDADLDAAIGARFWF